MTLRRRRHQHAHRMVYDTAMEMAHEVYSGLMSNNTFYDGWKKMNPGLSSEELEAKFCRQTAPQLLMQARAALAAMLSGAYPQEMKEKIAEALFLDNMLERGRGEGRMMKPLSQLM